MLNIIPYLKNIYKEYILEKEVTYKHLFIKFFTLIVLILLFIMSFLLGRLSSIFDSKPTFTLEDLNIPKNQNPIVTHEELIVASKSGKKYYFVWCKGVENIKEKNKIYFKSEDEAKAKGLELSNTCK